MIKILAAKSRFVIYFSWIILMGLTACSQHQDTKIVKPKDLIPSDQFVTIMVDVRLVETIIRQNTNKEVKVEDLTKYYYNSIFKKNNITEPQFRASLNYYSSIPEKMAEINEQAVEFLSEKESEVKAQQNIQEEEY